jgi:hypothetical protein
MASEKVDIVQQTKDNMIVSYSQMIASMTQQSAMFMQRTLAKLSDDNVDCYEILEKNMEGVKKLADANQYILDKSIESFEKIKNLSES